MERPVILSPSEIRESLKEFINWSALDQNCLTRTFKFPDFVSALKFVNAVGEVAESQGHHPDIRLSWGKVEVRTWTHSVDGITKKDFRLAAAIETAFESLKK
ncbi:MAG TPA: 4a-hydroxytetrahydrobiopterin dehydratase [Acidobacteriota bacterium]|nr:4a-hydroxytetrahydrobiopterin dehydratase [Acidobacteriota bacterium]